jgi:hypothetical protein
MGCRQWWGKPKTLEDCDLGVWHGRWLMGVNGPKPGRFELAFERWCIQSGHAFVRTVDLFWVFEYHRKGFPSQLDERPVRKNWREERKCRREAPRKIKEGRIFHLSYDLKKLSRVELNRYLDRWYPDPGPWETYFEERRTYFLEEQARYRRVVAFWKESAELRKMFLRCASYSNRRPESHPDYLVLFRGSDCVWVEVKSPRESVRPSQRQFFPELVREAGQRVMLVRLTEAEENLRFFEFNSGGDLSPCSAPLSSRPHPNAFIK